MLEYVSSAGWRLDKNYIKSIPWNDSNLLFDRDGFEYSMMLYDVMGKEFNFLKETLMHRFWKKLWSIVENNGLQDNNKQKVSLIKVDLLILFISNFKKIRKIQNSDGLLTIKNELEILKFGIFYTPMPKLCKSYEGTLIVIFYQWSKL